MGLLIRFWPYIAIGVLSALVVTLFAFWRGSLEDVGVWREKHRQTGAQVLALNKQLALANDKIMQTANEGAVSYGHCQDLAATDVARAFDKGTIFGRSTCAKPVP